MEEWRNVTREGYTDYEVSSLGRVRSNKFGRHKILKQIPQVDVRRNATSHYQVVRLYSNGKRIGPAVHILVAESFCGKPQGTTQVNHKDGVKDNNASDNLEWVTGKQNAHHAFTTGLRPPPPLAKGEMTSQAKLTPKDVGAIRSDTTMFQWQIAEMYNITQSNVSVIKSRKTWNHI
jgi:DNA-binding transcriptional regulator YiaG